IAHHNGAHQFYSVPHLRQLTDIPSIYNNEGCEECNMFAIRPMMRAEDEGRKRMKEAEERHTNPASNPNLEKPPRIDDDVGTYSISRSRSHNVPTATESAEILPGVIHQRVPTSLLPLNDELQVSQALSVEIPEKKESSFSSFPNSRVRTGFPSSLRPFDMGERWDGVPEPSPPIPWPKKEEETVYRNQAASSQHSMSQGPDWRSHDIQDSRPPSLLSLSMDAPQPKPREEDKEKHIFSSIKFVRPVRRASNAKGLRGIDQKASEESKEERDTPTPNQLIEEGECVNPNLEVQRRQQREESVREIEREERNATGNHSKMHGLDKKERNASATE
ncbi:hypothetical protein PENTCL1PPCAC_7361, partial [Pristionchus entomophagus]